VGWQAGVAEKHKFRVSPEDAGLRLDQLLAKRIAGLSRNLARRLIADGGVFVEQKRVKVASRSALVGQRVEVSQLTERERTLSRELSLKIDIAFEDAHLLLIDKPSGLLSAPSEVSDRNNALAIMGAERRLPLYLVHRLDRLTSGLLLFGKSLEATRALSLAFQNHDLERRYLAIVHGALPERAQAVDEPLDGRPARTNFEEQKRLLEASLVEATLETGRTHQVRRHALFLGCPIVGDPRYPPLGPSLAPPSRRLLLHAHHLGLLHPISGEKLSFDSPLPADMEAYLGELTPQP
jgi:23S rRNA pseudouridine1911/1915/1917 synthase